MTAIPPSLTRAWPVLRPEAREAANAVFSPAPSMAGSSTSGEQPAFRVFLDDTCAMPAKWRHHEANGSTGTGFDSSRYDAKYGAEATIPQMVARSPHAVSDWRLANASLVVMFVGRFGGAIVAPERCRRKLARDSPAFRANGGARHFFLFTQDFGSCTHYGTMVFPQFLRHHAIAIHGEREGHHWRHHIGPDLPCFSEAKDISIPPGGPALYQRILANSPLELRGDLSFPFVGGGTPDTIATTPEPVVTAPAKDMLVFYSGGGWVDETHREGRRLMYMHWNHPKFVDPQVLVRERVEPKLLYASKTRCPDRHCVHPPKVVSARSLYPHTTNLQIHCALRCTGMARAKYCPIMGGHSPWTTRLVEAVMHNCVPVFFSSWLPPFSRMLDWSRFSVRIETLDAIPRLKTILLAQDYERLASNLLAARHALWYRIPDFRGDDALPFLLTEMHLALKAAAIYPLDQQAEAVLGVSIFTAFLEHNSTPQTVAAIQSSSLRAAIISARSAISPRYRYSFTVVTNRTKHGPLVFSCAPTVNSAPLALTTPADPQKPFIASARRTRKFPIVSPWDVDGPLLHSYNIDLSLEYGCNYATCKLTYPCQSPKKRPQLMALWTASIGVEGFSPTQKSPNVTKIFKRLWGHNWSLAEARRMGSLPWRGEAEVAVRRDATATRRNQSVKAVRLKGVGTWEPRTRRVVGARNRSVGSAKLGTKKADAKRAAG